MIAHGRFGDEEIPQPELGTGSTGEQEEGEEGEEGKEQPGPSISIPEGPDARPASERGRVMPFDDEGVEEKAEEPQEEMTEGPHEEEVVVEEGLAQAESVKPVVPTAPPAIEPLDEGEKPAEVTPVQAGLPQIIFPPAPEPVEPEPPTVEKPRKARKQRKKAKKKRKVAKKAKRSTKTRKGK